MKNRLKRRVALSFSSWFCIPDQGMNDFEILSRASAFIVKARPNNAVNFNISNIIVNFFYYLLYSILV